MFIHEREGAFGNIVLWNGLLSIVGFLLTANVHYPEVATYCIPYNDGSVRCAVLQNTGAGRCSACSGIDL